MYQDNNAKLGCDLHHFFLFLNLYEGVHNDATRKLPIGLLSGRVPVQVALRMYPELFLWFRRLCDPEQSRIVKC
jgi:hypothetical protein